MKFAYTCINSSSRSVILQAIFPLFANEDYCLYLQEYANSTYIYTYKRVGYMREYHCSLLPSTCRRFFSIYSDGTFHHWLHGGNRTPSLTDSVDFGITSATTTFWVYYNLIDLQGSSELAAVQLRRRMYQKTFWQQAHLPYFLDLDREADDQFSRIKTGLAAAIILRDIRPAFVHFIQELNK